MTSRYLDSIMTAPIVEEYMSSDVTSVPVSSTVQEVSEKILKTGHDGFPVCNDKKLVGYIEAQDLLIQPQNRNIRELMQKNVFVARPSMKTAEIARLMLRCGRDEIPVCTENETLVGLITNTDVIRSHIERSTPSTIDNVTEMIEDVHDVTVSVSRGEVLLSELQPTQDRVFQDELSGRQYELEHNIAEPIVVIDNEGERVLVDGHHRCMAAREIGLETLDAFILSLSDSVRLGMVQSAKSQSVAGLADVKIDEGVQHPLFEKLTVIDSD